MNIADRAKLSRDRAESFVVHARNAIETKAATAGSLLSAATGSGKNNGQLDLYDAREQYSHFTGWVFACIRLLAHRIASQDILIAREAKTSTRGFIAKNFFARSFLRESLPLKFKSKANQLEPIPQHPLLDLLNDPSELDVSSSLMSVTIANLELTGRCLWHVTEDNGRRVIMPIPTHWIRDIDPKRQWWVVRPEGGYEDFLVPGNEACYFYYPNPRDPKSALSPLKAIGAAVLADEAIGALQWRTFKQGQFPGLILTAGRLPGVNGGEGQRPNFTADQRQQLIEACRQRVDGVNNFGEPMILDGLIESVTKLTFTPAELDFINSSKLTKSKILQGYCTSPILLGEVEGANRASATVADSIFCANRVNPLIGMLSQVMTQFLSPMFAADGEKLTIWIDKAVPDDPEMNLKKWEMGLRYGAVNRNDFRVGVMSMPAVAGLDDYRPGNQPAALPAPQQPAASPPDDTAGDKSASPASRLNPYSMYSMKAFANGSAH